MTDFMGSFRGDRNHEPEVRRQGNQTARIRALKWRNGARPEWGSQRGGKDFAVGAKVADAA
ncbi:hypothetical protein CCR91_04395 [Thiorhodovibrio winogradskyi]|jgi:hypothetical protein|nr:hypothetical protein [Thiorhodovibrio winogradskyi]